MATLSPREIRKFHTTEIYSMDGKKIGSMLIYHTETLSGSKWRRISEWMANTFDCEPDDVGCAQTEEHLDILTVDGKHVAYIEEQF